MTAALQAAKGNTTFPRHPDRSKDSEPWQNPSSARSVSAAVAARKFYDLSKDPIVCPKCGTVFEVVAPVARGRADGSRCGRGGGRRRGSRRRAPAKEAEAEAPETADVELVSLEDADAEAQGKKAAEAAEGDDDIEVEETEEAPFIEETGRGRRRRHRHHRRRPRGRRGDLISDSR